MKRILIVCLFAGCMAGRPGAAAQERVTAAGVRVSDVEFRKEGDVLAIGMRLDFSGSRLSSDATLQIVPLLAGEVDTVELPRVVVNGRRQQIMYHRVRRKQYQRQGLSLDTVVRFSRRNPGGAAYRQRVPYRAWMDSARLILSEIRCGCRGEAFASSRTPIRLLTSEVPEFEPQYAYLLPRMERKQSVHGSACLEFPVNGTEIRLDLARNAAELEKISQTIAQARNDPFVRIDRIVIHGYASPDGPYANNLRLAESRARAVKEYVETLYPLPDSVFAIRYTPEDWAGLERKVEQSGMPWAGQALAVIRKTGDPDRNERELREIGDGQPYRCIVGEFYPPLRRTEYTVEYDLGGFTVERARELLRERPQALSLPEIWMVARSYAPGSREFRETLELAVRRFPDDSAANLNAANLALEEGDPEHAEACLEKAGDSPEAENARGVLRMTQGRRDEAEAHFLRAWSQGLKQAGANLEQLRLQRENRRRRAQTALPAEKGVKNR